MRCDWREVRLGEVCEYVSDKILLADISMENYISTENMLPEKAGITIASGLPASNQVCGFQRGDVLVSNIRPYFKKIWSADIFGGCSNDVLIFRAKNDYDKNFLYYVLSNDAFFEYSMSTSKGTKMPRGDKTAIMNYLVPLPPLPEQKRIADILSALDDKIELNNRMNKNLEAQAQAIFKSWFVDFEPWGGVMPKDWREGSLLDIADYLNGLAMQKFRPKENEIGLPVLKIKELRQGNCDSSSELCSPNIKQEYIIHDGDVIFSWSGSLLVDIWCSGDCGLNQHLFKVSSQKYDKWFYYLWTCFHLKQFVSMAADKATTMGHIKRESLENARVIIPSSDDYICISAHLTPIVNQIIRNRVESNRLATLRDTLLPKLMNGEIDVKEVE